MKHDALAQHLSQITTVWTVLREAHDGSNAAQTLLVERYGGAVYRYLLRAVGDPHVAEELKQEFALDLIRGAYRRADPRQGRFRDYVKTGLFHLVGKYRKRQQRQARPLPPDSPELADLAVPPEDSDAEFNDGWRAELLARAWKALAESQAVYHAVLRFRAEHPRMPSHQMAEHLSSRVGKPLTGDGVRQTLRRARERFAELLIDEVGQSLATPSPELVEEELRELDLLAYCRPALDRLSGRAG
jgi:RNA polymerase sigma factor (sigma-70 family)